MSTKKSLQGANQQAWYVAYKEKNGNKDVLWISWET